MKTPVFVSQINDPDAIESWVRGRTEADGYKPEWNQCGICCVRMIALGLELNPPSLEDMYRTAFDAYHVFATVEDKVVGAYHRELAEYIEGEFKLKAEARRGLTTAHVVSLIGHDNYVIASVSPKIREQSVDPKSKTGHMMLVFKADGFDKDSGNPGFTIHNSAGFSSNRSQINMFVTPARFEQCFSGCGIVVSSVRNSANAPWRLDGQPWHC